MQAALENGQIRAAQARQQRVEEQLSQQAPVTSPAEDDILAGLQEENYTEEYRKVFAAIRKLASENKELKVFKAQAEQFLAGQANESQASFARKVDAQLSQLGQEYEPFIGKGRGHKLPPNSLERAIRNQLIQDAAVLAGKGASREEVIDQLPEAARKRFGQLVGEAPQRRVSRQPSRQQGVHPQFKLPRQQPEEAQQQGQYLTDDQIAWMNSGIRRPTQRAGAAEPLGREKAVNSVRQRLQEYRDSGGGYEEGYVTSEDDFLE